MSDEELKKENVVDAPVSDEMETTEVDALLAEITKETEDMEAFKKESEEIIELAQYFYPILSQSSNVRAMRASVEKNTKKLEALVKDEANAGVIDDIKHQIMIASNAIDNVDSVSLYFDELLERFKSSTFVPLLTKVISYDYDSDDKPLINPKTSEELGRRIKMAQRELTNRIGKQHSVDKFLTKNTKSKKSGNRIEQPKVKQVYFDGGYATNSIAISTVIKTILTGRLPVPLKLKKEFWEDKTAVLNFNKLIGYIFDANTTIYAGLFSSSRVCDLYTKKLALSTKNVVKYIRVVQTGKVLSHPTKDMKGYRIITNSKEIDKGSTIKPEIKVVDISDIVISPDKLVAKTHKKIVAYNKNLIEYLSTISPTFKELWEIVAPTAYFGRSVSDLCKDGLVTEEIRMVDTVELMEHTTHATCLTMMDDVRGLLPVLSGKDELSIEDSRAMKDLFKSKANILYKRFVEDGTVAVGSAILQKDLMVLNGLLTVTSDLHTVGGYLKVLETDAYQDTITDLTRITSHMVCGGLFDKDEIELVSSKLGVVTIPLAVDNIKRYLAKRSFILYNQILNDLNATSLDLYEQGVGEAIGSEKREQFTKDLLEAISEGSSFVPTEESTIEEYVEADLIQALDDINQSTTEIETDINEYNEVMSGTSKALESPTTLDQWVNKYASSIDTLHELLYDEDSSIKEKVINRIVDELFTRKIEFLAINITDEQVENLLKSLPAGNEGAPSNKMMCAEILFNVHGASIDDKERVITNNMEPAIVVAGSLASIIKLINMPETSIGEEIIERVRVTVAKYTEAKEAEVEESQQMTGSDSE